jgi:hypothetical protein
MRVDQFNEDFEVCRPLWAGRETENGPFRVLTRFSKGWCGACEVLPRRAVGRCSGRRTHFTLTRRKKTGDFGFPLASERYPATNGSAGGKLPVGNVTSRFPLRNFSEAVR